MLSRIKFEIDDLVDKILDYTPQEYFDSATTTFLDPSMAGGQFIRGIVRRLTKAGHSIDNIKSRVYGLADTPISENYVRNKYNNTAIGQFTNGGLEKIEEWNNAGKMFNVIIGNPPYNKKEGEPLYYNFLRMLSDQQVGSHFTYIIPVGWLIGPKAADIRNRVFDSLNISHMKLLTKETFDFNVTQQTVVITGTIGTPTTKFVFERKIGSYNLSVIVDKQVDVFEEGMPLYMGEEGKRLIHAARQ